MVITPATELEAVNEMLSVIGESPVSTLDSDGFVDAVIARGILTRVSREVQTRGWNFNTIPEYTLTPDSNGELKLPLNILKLDQHHAYDGRVDCVQRGLKVFDKKSLSFVFDEPVKFEVVQFLDFDELPEYAKTYITIRAARIFQTRSVGSETSQGLTQEEELRAHVEALSADGDVSDFTMLSGNYDVGRVIER